MQWKCYYLSFSILVIWSSTRISLQFPLFHSSGGLVLALQTNGGTNGRRENLLSSLWYMWSWWAPNWRYKTISLVNSVNTGYSDNAPDNWKLQELTPYIAPIPIFTRIPNLFQNLKAQPQNNCVDTKIVNIERPGIPVYIFSYSM